MQHRLDGLRVALALVVAVTLSALVATGVAVGQDAASRDAPSATSAAGEGAPIRGGVRNPGGSRREELREETQIIADTGRNEYGTRQSNKGEGGGAIYGCRSRLNVNDPVDPRRSTACVRSNNLSNGEAFQFSTDGLLAGVIQVGDTFNANASARPFVTNATGVATGLNADRVDGRDAAEIVSSARAKPGLAAESADDAARLEGRPASAFESADTVRTRGVTAVAEGATETLLSYGPFAIAGRCRDDGGDTVAEVLLATTENGTAVGGDATTAGDADVGPGDGPVLVDPGTTDAAGTGPSVSEGYDDQFSAFAPSGRAFSATVQSWADADLATCRFHGNLTVNG